MLHEPLIDEDPVFITTCTERELRKRKKRKFSLWVRQCTSTGFICQVLCVRMKEENERKGDGVSSGGRMRGGRDCSLLVFYSYIWELVLYLANFVTKTVHLQLHPVQPHWGFHRTS